MDHAIPNGLALKDFMHRHGLDKRSRPAVLGFHGLLIRAVEDAWGSRADYGQVVKLYDAEPTGPGRYSPPKVSKVEKEAIWGNPDMATLSTSIVERQNHNMRMSMRRFTRLTNGFSKKLETLKGAVALHFAHYNRTLRTSPAMAAGVEDRLWTLQELVGDGKPVSSTTKSRGWS